MTVSYNWLSEYLPEKIAPDTLSDILTSIGLEVESLEKYESIKGNLEGIIVGQVVNAAPHPNADKLKLTTVNIGKEEPLKIVCGALNVATGQKVLVATVGSTIYPVSGDPITLKAAKIRGEESQGMICAEDEIGLGSSHEGILILPADTLVGTLASEYFSTYNDWVYEIGLTPNRMDAMSHYGVAKDVCAYLTHHNNSEAKPRSPFTQDFENGNNLPEVKVTIENANACQRYAGVTINNVVVKESPTWLQNKLLAIGQKPINNIVDITNFILHETGQPLHAFDVDAITGNVVVIKTLPPGTIFTTLDGKERKLDSEDLVICNAKEAMCIAGVFGGLVSGVKNETRNIFLESAWFNPTSIRRTSFRHGLRTEAAARFEKGVDISNLVNVLKRAALLIKEVAGGEILSDIVDVYPTPSTKTKVTLKYPYLKKLSGKDYSPQAVKDILTALSFDIVSENMDEVSVAVPFSKPDITLPADIVEEILRIDGLDNVEFPKSITIAPGIDENTLKENLREKISSYLTGQGLNEILTNSITNSRYYDIEELASAVKMINSLSADLDLMRPSMIETGLEIISYNLNRKNKDLQLYEFGKTYHSTKTGAYVEREHLAIYLTGKNVSASWNLPVKANDFFRTKGLATAIIQLCGIMAPELTEVEHNNFSIALKGLVNEKQLVTIGEVSRDRRQKFDIKQPVYFVSFDWLLLLELVSKKTITYKEVPKFPTVHRDLAMVVSKNISFKTIENAVKKARPEKLKQVELFDIFENEKLGADKKSMALSFSFLDNEKTLTDTEVDETIHKIIKSFEEELSAEIRK